MSRPKGSKNKIKKGVDLNAMQKEDREEEHADREEKVQEQPEGQETNATEGENYHN